VPVNDSLGYPQAQAGADVLFGGEEGLEDSVAVLGWDSGTVVFNRDLNSPVAAFFNALQTDGDCSFVANRVGGVRDEI